MIWLDCFHIVTLYCGFHLSIAVLLLKFNPFSAAISNTEILKFVEESVITLPQSCALIFPLLYLNFAGYSQLYTVSSWDLNQSAYLCWCFFLYLFFVESWVYTIHRLQHTWKTTWLYKTHTQHHLHLKPTSIDTFDAHVLDETILMCCNHIFPFLMPIHCGLYFFMNLLYIVFNFAIHSKFKFSPGGLINDAPHHDLHHSKFNVNFSMYFTIFDKIFQTYDSGK